MDLRFGSCILLLAIHGSLSVGAKDICNLPAPDTCEPSLTGFFPHVLNCDRYIYCTRGTLYTFACKPGFWWDQRREICDLPKNVNCVACDSHMTPDLPDPGNCDGYRDFLPHESDCNKFYRCVHGEKVVMRCPFILYFNPKIKVCDWPRKSICSVG